MSGLVASFSLAWLAGLQAPGTSQLIALAFGVGAAGALSYPSAAVWWRTRSTGAACRVLFVCGGNTSRSPMAEVIAWAQAAEAGVAHLFRFSSAGVATTEPASPMTPGARSALAELGLQRVPGRGIPPSPLTPGHPGTLPGQLRHLLHDPSPPRQGDRHGARGRGSRLVPGPAL